MNDQDILLVWFKSLVKELGGVVKLPRLDLIEATKSNQVFRIYTKEKEDDILYLELVDEDQD